jgi:hypothetical protein
VGGHLSRVVLLGIPPGRTGNSAATDATPGLGFPAEGIRRSCPPVLGEAIALATVVLEKWRMSLAADAKVCLDRGGRDRAVEQFLYALMDVPHAKLARRQCEDFDDRVTDGPKPAPPVWGDTASIRVIA